jgi:outer membrane receptor protein involved in Fe transport
MKHRQTLATTILLGLMSHAFADSLAANTTPEHIDVTGKTDVRSNATIGRIVVGRDEIVRYGDQNVVDVLRRLPGVTVDGSAGHGAQIRLRGLGDGYTQILINGEPVPPGFSVGSLSPEQIERIEVLRSATADQGTQAIAGSINFILRKAGGKPQRSLKLTAASIHGRGADYADANFGDKADKLAYGLGASLSHEYNVWPMKLDLSGSDPSGPLFRHTDKTETDPVDMLALTPRLSYQLGEGESLGFDSLLRWRRDSGGAFDRRQSTGTPPTYVANDLFIDTHSFQHRDRLNWTQRFGDATLEMKLGDSGATRHSVAHFLGYQINGSPANDEHVHSAARDGGWTLTGKWRRPLGEAHSLAFGWDGEWADRTENRVQTEVRFDGIAPDNIDEEYHSTVRRLALFGQDEWTLSDAWSGYAGLRWEGLSTTSAGNVMETVSQHSGTFSPVLQTVFKPSASDRLRLALARTYKAPTARELMPRRYVANDNTPLTPSWQGNPNLRPELSWGLDAAWEHDIGKAGMVSLSAYGRQINDVILPSVQYLNGAWMEVRSNSGRADVWGLESDARLNLKQRDATLPAVELHGNLGLNRSRLSALPGPDNRLNQQVPWSANLGADWHLADRLTLGGNYGAQGSAWAMVNAEQRNRAAAKHTLDLYGVWKWRKDAQLRLSVSDALDSRQVAESRYDGNGYHLYQRWEDAGRTAVRAMVEWKL